jgi:S-adenosylmethionine decarboxylase
MQTKWLHIISEFFDYQAAFWEELDEIKQIFSAKIKEIWLAELWNYYHLFWKDAYTWIICLTESHISIHTWPESKFLTLDVYVCNYNDDNSWKAKSLFEFFKNFYKPKKFSVRYIKR